MSEACILTKIYRTDFSFLDIILILCLCCLSVCLPGHRFAFSLFVFLSCAAFLSLFPLSFCHFLHHTTHCLSTADQPCSSINFAIFLQTLSSLLIWRNWGKIVECTL